MQIDGLSSVHKCMSSKRVKQAIYLQVNPIGVRERFHVRGGVRVRVRVSFRELSFFMRFDTDTDHARICANGW